MSDLDFLAQLDATAQADLVARGALAADDLLAAYERRARVLEPILRATVATDLAAARGRPHVPGPFAGVPFLFKDVVAYPGLRVAFGARLFAGNIAAEGSPFTARVDAAGLVTVGKSATSELGLLGSTETLVDGVTHNPWNLAYSAAGSSGGAAAAVAAGLVPIAHASDGGGSIRVPASVCGVFGLKPSRGRTVPTSTAGSEFADLVSEGCVSRSVRDTAVFLAAVDAHHPDLAPLGDVREPSARRLRIATWTETLIGSEPTATVRAAYEDTVALCRALGHEVIERRPPPIDGAALGDGFFLVAGAAFAQLVDMMAAMLKRPVGAGDLEPFTRAVIADARRRYDPAVVRATFAAARTAYLAVFDACDVVLTPTLATPPWPLGHLAPWLDRETLLARTREAVCYTPIHNVAGCPAMSVPLHQSTESPEGLPLGSQFAADIGGESTLLGLAFELEQARPWRDRWPAFSFPRIVATP